MIEPIMPNSGLYVTPPETAYLTGKPFYMPTDDGSLWAVAFDARTSQYITSSITVTLTLMFSWIWGLLAAAAVYFAPHGFPRRRLVALILLRNTTDPRSALLAFLGYTTESMGWFRPKKKGNPATWRDTFFGTFFLLLALAIVLANVVMGIIIPPFLVVGSAAPVNPAALFSPNAKGLRGSPAIYRSYLNSGSLRSLSSVEIFEDAVKKAVRIQGDPAVTGTNTSRPMYGLTYEYKVTGVDFGLKRAAGLLLSVKGACKTEYDWITNENEVNRTVDIYALFNNADNRARVSLSSGVAAPKMLVYDVSTNETEGRQEIQNQADKGMVEYALVVTTASKNSSSESQDPWYLTELWTNTTLKNGSEHIISRARPVLHCWHEDTWSVPGAEPIKGVNNLHKITGETVPAVLLDVLRSALWYPTVAGVARDANIVSLESVIRTPTVTNGLLDASSSSLFQDMERLIQAAYVNTLNTLARTSAFNMTQPLPTNTSLFYDEGKLLPGADEFVVRTPDVLTFNLIGLITTGGVILLLLILKLSLHLKLSFYVEADPILGPHERDHNQEIPATPVEQNKDRWARFSAFSAVHLLRNAYEDGTGHPEDDWQCCEDLPEPTEGKKLMLVRCKGGNYGCAGHLATDLPGSRRRASTMDLMRTQTETPMGTTASEPRYSKLSQSPSSGGLGRGGMTTYFPRQTPPLSVPSPVSEPALNELGTGTGGRFTPQEMRGQQWTPQQWQEGPPRRESPGVHQYPGQGYRGQQYRDEEPSIHSSPLLPPPGGYPPRY
ncbi:hypothetical protein OQA88_11562 [Cercophora sp. LCS_1]